MLSSLRVHHLDKFMLAMALSAACLLSSFGGLSGQEPFLTLDFDDETLQGLFDPDFVEFAVCDADLPLLPVGSASTEDAELRLTNDDQFGISIVTLDPADVPGIFPDSRDYKVRLQFQFDTASQLSLGLKGRLGVDIGSGAIASVNERSYSVSIFPDNIDIDFTDGVVTIAEFDGCHSLIDHPEWPNAAGFDYGRAAPDSPIVRGDWYWIEASVTGNEDGGPVTISAKVWLDGDAEPELPQLVVVDKDGLPLDTVTRDPAVENQFSLAASLDYPPGDFRDPNAELYVDDITFTEIGGCTTAPAMITRELWESEVLLIEGKPTKLFDDGADYDITLRITDPRPEGDCDVAATVLIQETFPADWTVLSTSEGGEVQDNTIVWTVDVSGQDETTVGYSIEAAGFTSPSAIFSGQYNDEGSDRTFTVGGDRFAAASNATSAINDFGAIGHWLILGPFLRGGGANPGDDQIVRDYLHDGAFAETELLPSAGDSVEPDYGGDSAADGLADNDNGYNPGDVPTWVEWRDLDDEDDRVDFESVYGPRDDVVCYAVTYLNVEEDTLVNFACSSDDSVHILLDGETLHANNQARGALDRNYQDLPGAFPNLKDVELLAGQHVVMVKIFEGGGEHNFRFGFVDELDVPLSDPPEGIEISLAPETVKELIEFRRGDADGDGVINITDGIFILNFLFIGGSTPSCKDSADADDSAQINITDGIFVLNFLFLGGVAPPAPGITCGEDPSDDALGDCTYESC